jgi:hypothetical protein
MEADQQIEIELGSLQEALTKSRTICSAGLWGTHNPEKQIDVFSVEAKQGSSR